MPEISTFQNSNTTNVRIITVKPPDQFWIEFLYQTSKYLVLQIVEKSCSYLLAFVSAKADNPSPLIAFFFLRYKLQYRKQGISAIIPFQFNETHVISSWELDDSKTQISSYHFAVVTFARVRVESVQRLLLMGNRLLNVGIGIPGFLSNSKKCKISSKHISKVFHPGIQILTLFCFCLIVSQYGCVWTRYQFDWSREEHKDCSSEQFVPSGIQISWCK